MFLKVTLFLLVLTVSQVIANLIRSFNVLETRQIPQCSYACDGLTPENCTVVSCICTPMIAGRVQECVNCASGGYAFKNPTQSTVDSVLDLIDLYSHTCAGVPGLTIPKWPFWVTTQITTRVHLPTPSPSITPGDSHVVTITVDGSTHGGVLPSVVPSEAERGKRSGISVITALLSAATVSFWISS